VKAKLKENYVYSSMRACGGTMFNKIDWTEVPPEHEKSALVNADLVIEHAPVNVPAVKVTKYPAPVVEPVTPIKHTQAEPEYTGEVHGDPGITRETSPQPADMPAVRPAPQQVKPVMPAVKKGRS
jgi:hypothetical protein